VCGAYLSAATVVAIDGELPAGLVCLGREATVKVYGVAVAIPQG
jgi:hypothetical protein